jgi:hypothetical protein
MATIVVRVVWSNITPNSHQFEQSFSDDGARLGSKLRCILDTKRVMTRPTSKPQRLIRQPAFFDAARLRCAPRGELFRPSQTGHRG